MRRSNVPWRPEERPEVSGENQGPEYQDGVFCGGFYEGLRRRFSARRAMRVMTTVTATVAIRPTI